MTTTDTALPLVSDAAQSSSRSRSPGSSPPSQASKRKIAHLACNACRRRRIRCIVPAPTADRPDPDCAYCVKIGVQCVFSGQDRRRETIQSLRARLEAQARQRDDGPDARQASTLDLFQTQAPLQSIQSSLPALTHPGHVPSKESVSNPAPTASTSQNAPTFTSPKPRLLPLSDAVDTLTFDDTGEIRAIAPLSAHGLSTGAANVANTQDCNGSHQAFDGSIIFTPPYGAPDTSTAEESKSYLPAAALCISDLPMGTDIRIVDHLIHIYMCWHHSVFPIISRRAFTDSFHNGGRYYTALLLNAILSLSCHLSHWPLLNASGVPGDSFFDEAKRRLEDELANPSLCTVQALCLMAKREVYCGRGLRGGLYFSMAGRLVMDLGLHLNPSPLIEQGFLTPFDGYVRCCTFWGVWTVDKEFGAMLGRPGTLIDLNITCPRPPYWKDDDFHWAKSVQSGFAVPLSEIDSQQDGCLFVGKLNLDISLIHEQLAGLVYRTKENPNPQSVLETVKTGLHELDGLFPSQSNTSVLESPLLMTSRLFAQDQTIIFCRPFALTDAYGSSVRHQARDLCFIAAEQIVELMELIKAGMPHGMRTTLNGHIHSLLYAAWVFLYELVADATDNEADRRTQAGTLLRRIISLLEVMAEFRPAADQALKNLRSTLARAEATKATQLAIPDLDDATVPSNGSEAYPLQHQHVLSWPTDGLDAFLFSSVQYANLDNVRPQESENTWLSTAALFQSQGDWATFR